MEKDEAKPGAFPCSGGRIAAHACGGTEIFFLSQQTQAFTTWVCWLSSAVEKKIEEREKKVAQQSA